MAATLVTGHDPILVHDFGVPRVPFLDRISLLFSRGQVLIFITAGRIETLVLGRRVGLQSASHVVDEDFILDGHRWAGLGGQADLQHVTQQQLVQVGIRLLAAERVGPH